MGCIQLQELLIWEPDHRREGAAWVFNVQLCLNFEPCDCRVDSSQNHGGRAGKQVCNVCSVSRGQLNRIQLHNRDEEVVVSLERPPVRDYEVTTIDMFSAFSRRLVRPFSIQFFFPD